MIGRTGNVGRRNVSIRDRSFHGNFTESNQRNLKRTTKSLGFGRMIRDTIRGEPSVSATYQSTQQFGDILTSILTRRRRRGGEEERRRGGEEEREHRCQGARRDRRVRLPSTDAGRKETPNRRMCTRQARKLSGAVEAPPGVAGGWSIDANVER